jgi:Tol biopolymer transport system component
LLLIAALAGMAVWSLKPSPLEQPQPVTRTTINLPPGRQLAGLDQGSAVALSGDGSYLAYIASQNGAQQIYLRPMNSLQAKPIAGTEGAVSPFFSPDDRWLGFFADGNLRKIYVSGGAALDLAEAPKPAGAAWSSAGLIAFAPKPMGPIQQIVPSGGSVQPLTRLRGVEFSHRWPAFLPNSKAALFSAGEPAAGWSNAQVGIQLPGGSIWRTLIEDATYPQYASSGHLIYAQNGNLMAVPFDLKRMATAGSPVPVVEGVLQSVSSGASQYAVSENGTLVYVPGTMQSTKSKLVRVSRDGKEQPLAAPENTYREPRFSPDGKQIAVDSASQVWIYNSSRESLTPFTFGGSNDAPVWSPDGKQIAFQCHLQQAAPNLCLQMADGSGAIVRLTSNPNRQAPNSWSSDGETLAYIEVNPATGFDIWTLHVGDRKATPFLQSPFNESAPRFSPDGHWLAYISDESGRFEIYIQPFPGPGGKWQISTDGGTEPVWNPNGREFFYHNGTKLMAVGITTQPAFSVSKPHVLFEGNYVLSPVTFPNYDVAPDGQYFLMFKPDEQTQAVPAQINVALNWFQELRRLAPPAKQ